MDEEKEQGREENTHYSTCIPSTGIKITIKNNALVFLVVKTRLLHKACLLALARGTSLLHPCAFCIILHHTANAKDSPQCNSFGAAQRMEAGQGIKRWRNPARPVRYILHGAAVERGA